MNKYLKIILIALGAVVGFLIGKGIAIWYKDVLQNSGGVVTAQDLISVKLIPFFIALLALAGTWYLTDEK